MLTQSNNTELYQNNADVDSTHRNLLRQQHQAALESFDKDVNESGNALHRPSNDLAGLVKGTSSTRRQHSAFFNEKSKFR